MCDKSYQYFNFRGTTDEEGDKMGVVWGGTSVYEMNKIIKQSE